MRRPPKQPPLLCYVTDRRALANYLNALAEQSVKQSADLSGQISRAVLAGVDWIQIREKDLPAHELLALVRFAVSEAGKSVSPARVHVPNNVRILVNDRLDVALAAGAAGTRAQRRLLHRRHDSDLRL